jgi:hypothetical protein
MIIWSRWGIVVLAFVGLGIGAGFLIMNAVGVQSESGPVSGIFVGLGLMLSGVGLWFFTKHVLLAKLDKPRPVVVWENAVPATDAEGRVLGQRAIPVMHPETGQPMWTQPQSTFFFIPVVFWSYVLPVLGLVIFLANLITVMVES